MNHNPNFTVRFYVRTTKTQGGDSLTPLRVKVWISGTKSYLYYSTKVSTTKRIWADFASDGTPSPGADPTLTKVVDTYKTATNLIVSSAIANDRIKELTSEQLSLRIDAVVAYMEKQQEEHPQRPILVFSTPHNSPFCMECCHCGTKCKAKWQSEDERDIAPDLTLYGNKCPHFKTKRDISILDWILARVVSQKTDHPELSTEVLLCETARDCLIEYVDIIGSDAKQSSAMSKVLSTNKAMLNVLDKMNEQRQSGKEDSNDERQ